MQPATQVVAAADEARGQALSIWRLQLALAAQFGSPLQVQTAKAH